MREKNLPKYRFPWREHNHFSLLIDGAKFFPNMLSRIAAAKHYILLEMYLFESSKIADQFIESLTTAAHNGVKVYLLLDDFGARLLQLPDRERLQHHNIQLIFYNPMHRNHLHLNLFRDHRKLLVVDGKVAYTGGAGITDGFDQQQHPQRYWHDTMIRIEGPIIHDWQQLFEENWNRWAQTPTNFPTISIDIPAGNQPGRLVHSHAPINSEIMRSFVRRIRNAERRIWLSTAYFVPPWKLRRALRRSARNGTDVRIMLPGPHTDHPGVRHMGRRYYTRLLRSGVRIFEYHPRFLHAKILLCDYWSSIGSSNVDRWNYRWNLDANQEIDDPDFAQQVQEQFEHDFRECHEILYEQWQRRPWRLRLSEWFWGRIVALLSWYSERKGSRHRPD
jgi:phosphatidylserine/phosphatidylglycerophosphate/cardiolipin synthase-like enzyme